MLSDDDDDVVVDLLGSKLIDRAELHLTNIAEAVQDDWEALADELGVDRKEVEKNTSASDSKSEKVSNALKRLIYIND